MQLQQKIISCRLSGQSLMDGGRQPTAQSNKIIKRRRKIQQERADRQSILAVFLLCRGRIKKSCSFLAWVSTKIMAFFTSAIGILKTLVVAIGAGLAVWGVINLLEGYGNDNPGAKSQGIKQLKAN